MKKLLFTLIAITIITAVSFAQNTGIGTTTPDTSAKLEVASTTQGFLPPRMTTAQRDDIATPARGLFIYNLDTECLDYYNSILGSWKELCGTERITIPGNATCEAATISATNCTAGELASGINGGSLGNKYANGAGGGYSVVNIGNQCWMAENIDINPAGSPAWVNNTDTGWYGYNNNSYQVAGDGTLLQWSVAMNGSTTERAQGVCPTGWHVPSDCEFMYLENTLGMSVAQQETSSWRGTDQGTQLKKGGTSQYEANLSGRRSGNDGLFYDLGTSGISWTSSESNATHAGTRGLNSNFTKVSRYFYYKNNALTVRCLKD